MPVTTRARSCKGDPRKADVWEGVWCHHCTRTGGPPQFFVASCVQPQFGGRMPGEGDDGEAREGSADEVFVLLDHDVVDHLSR